MAFNRWVNCGGISVNHRDKPCQDVQIAKVDLYLFTRPFNTGIASSTAKVFDADLIEFGERIVLEFVPDGLQHFATEHRAVEL